MHAWAGTPHSKTARELLIRKNPPLNGPTKKHAFFGVLKKRRNSTDRKTGVSESALFASHPVVTQRVARKVTANPSGVKIVAVI